MAQCCKTTGAFRELSAVLMSHCELAHVHYDTHMQVQLSVYVHRFAYQ